MNQIKIAAIPSQVLQVILDNQDCTIKLYQRGGHMYMDLAVGDTDIFAGAICLDKVSVAQFRSPNFKGALYFYDTQGTSAPTWEGLGTRFLLLYVAEGEAL